MYRIHRAYGSKYQNTVAVRYLKPHLGGYLDTKGSAWKLGGAGFDLHYT